MVDASDQQHGRGSESWEWFGGSSVLVARAIAAGELDAVALADRIENDATYLADVHRAANNLLVETGDVDGAAPYSARSATHGLISTGTGTRLLERVRPALEALEADSPAWPGDWEGSVTRFVQLIAGADVVIWSDRYMYRDIEPLRRFLREVIERTGARVLLLGSGTVSDRRVSPAEIARLTSIPGVEARLMTHAQYRDLHERHLATGSGGWVLPQVHVLVGRQDPGSAVAAATTGFGVDYWEMWRAAET